MVDALLKKLPYANPNLDEAVRPHLATSVRPQTIVVTPYREPKPTPFAVWGRLVLALIIGGAIVRWPYARDCGWLLVGYGAVVALVFGSTVWASIFAWRAHLVLPHLVTQVLLVWSLVLMGEVVLPRVGYARASAGWSCSAELPAERQPASTAAPAEPSVVVPQAR